MTRQLTCTIPVGCIPEKITRPVPVEYCLHAVRKELDAVSKGNILIHSHACPFQSRNRSLLLGLFITYEHAGRLTFCCNPFRLSYSTMEHDTQYELEPPGKPFDFEDVTTLFERGVAGKAVFIVMRWWCWSFEICSYKLSKELEPNGLIFMDDFTLQEAMTALQVQNPHITKVRSWISAVFSDRRAAAGYRPRPPRIRSSSFRSNHTSSPGRSLLDPGSSHGFWGELLSISLQKQKKYVLYIQLEFYSGNFLAHSVHTLLYIHHLDKIDPERVTKWLSALQCDSHRPLPLITIVLRSAVQAVLKCVELSWRELARGGMYDVRLTSFRTGKRQLTTYRLLGGGLAKRQIRCQSSRRHS